MSAFAAANDVIFEDANLSVPALWREGGTADPVSVRVVISEPDQEVSFNRARIIVGTVWIHVRMSEVAALASGDTFEVYGALYTVNGDPSRDDLAMTWRAEART